MTEANTIDGSENLYAIQLSDDRRLTLSQLADYITASYVFDKTNMNTSTIAGKLNELANEITSTTNLLPYIYPVGAIYWSRRDTSPSSFFGGTWTRIQSRFILGASSKYPVNSTGGEEKHTLSVSEMPSHDHGGKTGEPSNNNTGAASGSTGDNDVAHKHEIPSLTGTATDTGGHTHHVQTYPTGDWEYGATYWNLTWSGSAATGTLSTAGEHSHTATTDASTTGAGDTASSHAHTMGKHTHSLSNHTHTISNEGNSGGHNNMPPYVVYYCWERTA